MMFSIKDFFSKCDEIGSKSAVVNCGFGHIFALYLFSLA